MKTKINNPIRKLLFLLLAFLTVIGCQKETDDAEPQNLIDDNPVSNEYQNRNLDIKVSGYSDFQNDSNFNSIINGLSLSDRFAGNNIANRTGNNDVYGFTIDTTEIRQVQFDGYTSYTFKVYREESVGLFENLVVEVNDEGERAYIASYIPDQQYLDDISNGIVTEFNGTVRIENISSNTSNRNSNIANRSGCGSYYVIVETQCPCVGHWPGQSCECGTQPSTTWYTFDYPCDDGGGYTEGPIGPRGGGGGGGTPTNDDSVTAPIIPTDSDGNSVAPLFLINALGGNSALSTEQIIWINDPNNADKISILLNYMSENGMTNTNSNFISDVIEALIETNEPNPTLSDYPGKDDGMPFEWWLDEDFVNNNFSFDLDDEGFGDLTKEEKLLVVAFPVQALIIRENKEPAETETENRFGFSARNDKSDAFRHAFFNAMNSNDAGDTVARLFSTAHESEVPANLILEVQMDLHNNDIGHTIGDDASFFVSDQELSNSVYSELLSGNLFYLSPLDPVVPPNFGINSSTQLTPTNQ